MSPTPRPVVSSSSPPSSHDVGSESSETWSQRTSRARPADPPAAVMPSSSIDAMSRTVSIGRSGERGYADRRGSCKPIRRRVQRTCSVLRRSVHCAGQRGDRIIATVSLREETAAASVLGERRRYVARGVATPRLVVARAEGAWIEDVDGNRLLDFAGGIACQNLGHGFAPVVAAIHEQVDRYLHQCFMVGTYEPYVEVCRRLGELWPGPTETRSLLVNSGAEGIENAVKIARSATGRPGVVVFD